jgi:hypothetical protein
VVKVGNERVLGEIFKKPWFSRMWTVQEICMQSHSVILQYGTTTVSWDSMLAATRLIKINQEQGDIILSAVQDCLNLKLLLDGTFDRLGMREVRENNNIFALSNILDFRNHRVASDPRDMIFSLYGLLLTLGIKMDLPDYHQDISSVYSAATQFVIKYDNSLQILRKAQKSKRKYQLPSWVVDWTMKPAGFNDDIGSRFLETRSRALFSFSHDNQVLTLRGRIVDEIEVAGDVLPSRDWQRYCSIKEESSQDTLDGCAIGLADHLSDSWPVFRDWAQVFHRFDSVHLVNHDAASSNQMSRFAETIYSFLKVEEMAEDSPRAPDMPRLMSAAVQELCDLAADPEKILSVAIGVAREVTLHDNPATLRQLVEHMEDQVIGEFQSALRWSRFRHQCFRMITVAFGGKSFFSTRQGYHGIMFGAVKPGSILCFVSGLDEPLVVSPHPGGYEYVGIAYVPELNKETVWPNAEEDLEPIRLI